MSRSECNRSRIAVVMLKMGSAVMNLKFDGNTSVIVEDYDLQGIQIRSISLPWAPYLMQSGCTKDGTGCANEGYLIDYMDISAKQYNFTYVSLKEPKGDWGISPKSGPFNLSGTWGGVFGSVVNQGSLEGNGTGSNDRAFSDCHRQPNPSCPFLLSAS
jgi:hypothetical protein